MDKIGIQGVEKELEKLEIDEEKIKKIKQFIEIEGSNEEILKKLKELNITNEVFQEGLEELEIVNNYIKLFGVPEENYKIELTIARGLDYYTGTVYETYLDDYISLGSICSGGRYDNLASHYTKQKLPGVGISIGLSRLFFQLREANIIEAKEKSLTKVLIIPMKGFIDEGVKTVNILRKEGIYSQVYLDSGKMGKKFAYADKLNIPYVVVLGQDEIENEAYSFRDMKSGEQESLSMEELIKCLKA